MESLQRVTAEELQRMLGILCFLFDSVKVVDCGEEMLPFRIDKAGQVRSHPLLMKTPLGDRTVLLELDCRPIAVEEAKIAEEIWEKVYRDSLTHTYNRRYLEEFRFLENASPIPLGLILLDLRKFKQINDTLGHTAGDHVLIRVAETLMAHQRKKDSVVRFGGDEFVLLFPGIERSSLLDRTEELRSALEKVAKADFGYAWTENFRAETQQLNRLLNEADRRMYMEKRRDKTE